MTVASARPPTARARLWKTGVLLGGLFLAFSYFVVITSRLPGVEASSAVDGRITERHVLDGSSADKVMGAGAVVALVALLAAILFLLRRSPRREPAVLLAVAVICTLPAGPWFAAVAAIYSVAVIKTAPA